MSGFGEFVGKLYNSASESCRQAARWMVSSMANAAIAVKAEAHALASSAGELVTAFNDGAHAMADKARALFGAANKAFSSTQTPRETLVQPCVYLTPVMPVLAKSMTQAQAQAFMDKFKASDIPFDFPPDCCYARARVMCDIMEKAGFASEKLWSQGTLAARTAGGMPVTFPDKTGQSQKVTWRYHVAPLVNVVTTSDIVEQRILDPSLSNQSLTVTQWKTLCGVSTPAMTVDIITAPNELYPFDPSTAGKDFTVDEAEESLIGHRISRDDALDKASGF